MGEMCTYVYKMAAAQQQGLGIRGYAYGLGLFMA